jgi:hypothetical protein
MNSRRRVPIVAAILCAIAVSVSGTGCAGDVDDDPSATAVPSTAAQAADTPVQDFIEFAGVVDSRRQGSNADPQYIVEGLRKLAGALGTLGLGTPDLQVDLRVAAEHLLLSPMSPATTVVVRDGLIAAAAAIQAGHRIEHGELRRLAASISVQSPVLDQQAIVSTFFREAAAAIERPPPSVAG